MWKLDHKKSWMPKNWCFCTVELEKTLESLLDCKDIKPVNPKGNQSSVIIGRTDAETEAPIVWLTHWKRPWCWERLRAREGGDRGWDGWMASLTQWAWAWANSRRSWRTRKPGVLQVMGLQSQTWLRDWAATCACTLRQRFAQPGWKESYWA